MCKWSKSLKDADAIATMYPEWPLGEQLRGQYYKARGQAGMPLNWQHSEL